MTSNLSHPLLPTSRELSGVTASQGARYLGAHRCEFQVWAPKAEAIEVCFYEPEAPDRITRTKRLEPQPFGYHAAVIDDVHPGALYRYRLQRKHETGEHADPASRFQPFGVHGPSAVVDQTEFRWSDESWIGPQAKHPAGLELERYVFYELHVGTMTREGTFDAVIPHLQALKDLGITAIEIMPVAQFPGTRNWGYDGVYPYAVQNSYGGLNGLKRLVDACHRLGLAVVLDVVYNHLGPEGNYLGEFGPYFTERYHTPWGAALNFDGPHSDHVRRYFIDNALYWCTEFHIDALRLDAIHGIADSSAFPFLAELSGQVHARAAELGRRIYVIAESDLNDARVLRSVELGGFGMDSQWSDDLHHALHVLLTGEQTGYYRDFGRMEQLAKAFEDGYVYSGQYSAYRRRRHGNSSRTLTPRRFVVFSQNHDQVGNRLGGERLAALVDSFEVLKLIAATVLLSPFLPLLFMGEEYGETAPFLYFVSHSEEQLIAAVRKGRREEFASFAWQGELSDPQAEQTFARSKLNYELRDSGKHRLLWEFYRELLSIRTEPSAAERSAHQRAAERSAHQAPSHWVDRTAMHITTDEERRTLAVERGKGTNRILLLLNFGDAPASFSMPSGVEWRKRLDSADDRWGGAGSSIPEKLSAAAPVRLAPKSAALFRAEGEPVRAEGGPFRAEGMV